MARQARIKPSEHGTYYHVMNRIGGLPGEYPFDDVAKEKLAKLFREWSEYFTVEPIAYQVMGNHYHLVCYAASGKLIVSQNWHFECPISGIFFEPTSFLLFSSRLSR